MSYFFSKKDLKIGEEFALSGEEAGHLILSRRIKVGEKIKVQDVAQRRFLAEVLAAGRGELKLRVLAELPVPAEPALAITIFPALIKEKQLDFILQKSTELGAHAVHFFNAANTPLNLSELSEHKLTRWQKICQEAAKQSERVSIPALDFSANLSEVIKRATGLDLLLILDVSGKEKVSALLEKLKQQNLAAPKFLGIIIGPEGGLTEQELAECQKLSNAHLIKLGPRVLRAETAAIAALAIVQALFGDLA